MGFEGKISKLDDGTLCNLIHGAIGDSTLFALLYLSSNIREYVASIPENLQGPNVSAIMARMQNKLVRQTLDDRRDSEDYMAKYGISRTDTDDGILYICSDMAHPEEFEKRLETTIQGIFDKTLNFFSDLQKNSKTELALVISAIYSRSNVANAREMLDDARLIAETTKSKDGLYRIKRYDPPSLTPDEPQR